MTKAFEATGWAVEKAGVEGLDASSYVEEAMEAWEAVEAPGIRAKVEVETMEE